MNADNFKEEGKLDKIREDRGYTYEDEVILDKCKVPDYDAKVINQSRTLKILSDKKKN